MIRRVHDEARRNQENGAFRNSASKNSVWFPSGQNFVRNAPPLRELLQAPYQKYE